jgi:hypothetical protein
MFKQMKSLVSLPESSSDHIVHWICHHFALEEIEPIPASQVVCPGCGGSKGLAPLLDPSVDASRVWFCTNGCKCHIPAHPRKKLIHKVMVDDKWKVFMEEYNIGDIYETVSFTSIHQPEKLITALREFTESPSGVLTLTGTPGTGKTFAALSACQLFLASDHRVKFYTAIELGSRWSNRINSGDNQLMDQLKNTRLLVIDDLCQGSVKPSLLELLFEVVAYRLQWKDKGTIFTTNLEPSNLLEILGEAMSDRLRGQKWLKTTGKSRR